MLVCIPKFDGSYGWGRYVHSPCDRGQTASGIQPLADLGNVLVEFGCRVICSLATLDHWSFRAGCENFGIDFDVPPSLSIDDAANVDDVRLELICDGIQGIPGSVTSDDGSNVIFRQLPMEMLAKSAFVPLHSDAALGSSFKSVLSSECRLSEFGTVEQIVSGSINPVLLSGTQNDGIFEASLYNLEDESILSVFTPGVLKVPAMVGSSPELGFMKSPSRIDVAGAADVSTARSDMDDEIDTGMFWVFHDTHYTKCPFAFQSQASLVPGTTRVWVLGEEPTP